MFAQMFTGKEQPFFLLVSGFTLQLLFAGGLCCYFSLICFWFLELSQQSGGKTEFLPFLVGGKGNRYGELFSLFLFLKSMFKLSTLQISEKDH